MFNGALRVFLLGVFSLQAMAGGLSDTSYYAARREALMKKIEGSIAVLQGAPETRAYTNFRQDNNFYYLTGVETPNAFLLVDAIRHQSILFLPHRDKDRERWDGAQLFPGSEARETTGIDEVLDVSKFTGELGKRGSTLKRLYTPLAPMETAAVSRDRAAQIESARQSDSWDGRVSRETAFAKNLQSKLKLDSISDLSPVLDEMRRVKDAQEIERLREAGRIGALGLKEAIRSAKPGMYEYQAASVAEFVFLWNGASGFAFFPIVGSGPNSCILHYNGNGRRMEEGDLVVMDFGPDYRYYESDITRTFPVSGKFDAEQAKVYQAVLDAQKAVIQKVRPGATFGDLNNAARSALDLHGYARFMNHGVSHYVGMSTHDVGKSEPFEPGVVLTIEPGVYMPDKGIGIRIEDTALVTSDGCEILTGEVPKEISEIEKLMTEKGIAAATGN
jgi:Xaa-Pro aminopeptidase